MYTYNHERTKQRGEREQGQASEATINTFPPNAGTSQVRKSGYWDRSTVEACLDQSAFLTGGSLTFHTFTLTGPKVSRHSTRTFIINCPHPTPHRCYYQQARPHPNPQKCYYQEARTH